MVWCNIFIYIVTKTWQESFESIYFFCIHDIWIFVFCFSCIRIISIAKIFSTVTSRLAVYWSAVFLQQSSGVWVIYMQELQKMLSAWKIQGEKSGKLLNYWPRDLPLQRVMCKYQGYRHFRFDYNSSFTLNVFLVFLQLVIWTTAVWNGDTWWVLFWELRFKLMEFWINSL